MQQRQRSSKAPDPRRVRLSEHFLLSDFLGTHSVYAKGVPNDFDTRDAACIANGRALCERALEPLLKLYGPLSISYGAIGPKLSDKIVKYQDPRKPSHHLWSLGAAADVCVHDWVNGRHKGVCDLTLHESVEGAPIGLAYCLDYLDVPYSRIISYSESPYLCVAISHEEVEREQPRKAMYENRYQGKKGGKPEYIRLPSLAARNRHFTMLQEQGLEHDWRGAGYPTYHGGGFRQYQHQRVSKYTMLSDWLFDLKSITNGAKNVPALNSESVQDAFAGAGLVYDWLIETLEVPRLSIVSGYVSHLNPHFDPDNDWRQDIIKFTVSLPEGVDANEAKKKTNHRQPWTFIETREKEELLEVTFSVEDTMTSIDFD